MKIRKESNMKKIFVIVAVAVFSFYMFGCGKKQAAEEEQPMSMEALSTLSTTTQAPATTEPTKTVASKSQMIQAQPLSAAPSNLEPLPPAGPYKPTGEEIQTALKNANFYTGAIDGKIGPMTKKAIKAFQAANNLQADGKIGPKTWAALGKYLNPQPVTPVKKKR
jgi:peptidoglycan hydrolase-like protein with peptidoglycan-binding domain